MPVLIARTAGILALTAGLLVGVASGAVASDEVDENSEVGERKPDQHMNFDCTNCDQDTTVGHGYTYIYVTCWNQAWNDHQSWYATATSPEVGITCQSWNKTHGYVQCISDAKHWHTVKVYIYDCIEP